MVLFQIILVLASFAAKSYGKAVGSCPPVDPVYYMGYDDTDCTIFYKCLYGQWVPQNCPSGLVFHPNLNICVWPSDYQCPNAVRSCPVPCGVNGTCDTNTTTATCVCKPGFEGASCEQDINECAQSNQGGCRGNCSNTVGSYICTCPSPLVLASDGVSCLSTSCGPVNCQNGGVCSIVNNQASCSCPAGYSGSQCQTITGCGAANCQNGGNCTIVNNQAVCSCPAGYSGPQCERATGCGPANCQNGGNCTIVNNQAVCSCPAGYSGSQCQNATGCGPANCQNGGNCTIINNQAVCSCPAGYSGSQCQIASSCGPANCQNGATCSIVNGQAVCNCTEGFTGPQCDQFDYCSVANCQNGANCSIVNDSSICNCPAGFTGPQCENATSRALCQSSGIVCQNGGQCVDSSGTATCQCPSNFSGTYCEKAATDLCAQVTCFNNGTCQQSATGLLSCTCPNGFAGNFCELVVNCDNVICLNDGKCGVVNNTAGCQCVAGTSGAHCQNRQACGASGAPCQNGGQCYTTPQGFLCGCTFGYTGVACQTKRTCKDDFIECQNGGTCQDTANGASCSCAAGFTGYNCETALDQCGGCVNGGVCRGVPLPNITDTTKICACPSGFTDDKCQTASANTIPCAPEIGKDTDLFYLFPDTTSRQHVYYCEEGLLQRVELCPKTSYNIYKLECLTDDQYAQAVAGSNDLYYPQ
jgi:hypothetical protein